MKDDEAAAASRSCLRIQDLQSIMMFKIAMKWLRETVEAQQDVYIHAGWIL